MNNVSLKKGHPVMHGKSVKSNKQAALDEVLDQYPSLADKYSSNNWLINLITLVFVCIGIGIFVYPLVINYMNYQEQSQAINRYEKAVAKLSPQQIQHMWSDAIQYNIDLGTPTLKDPFKFRGVAPPLDRYERTLNVDGQGMLAYIDVPKINMLLPIYHGTSDQVLLEGGGHIVTTQLPTTQASVHPVLTGHTGSVGHLFFDNIPQLRKGDVFQLTVLNRHMSYQVDQIKVIEPTDTSAIQPEYGKNWVTLLTCYPYGVNNRRYLVRAKYIGDNVAPTVSPGAPIWVLWILLIAVLLICIAIWRLIVRRSEFTKELNARKKKHELNQGLDQKSDSEVPLSENGLSSKTGVQNRTQKFSVFQRRAIFRAVRHFGYTDAQIRQRRRQLLAAIWFLIALALLFMWASFGLMMRTGFLPIFDWGYSWFDHHVFFFFDILSR